MKPLFNSNPIIIDDAKPDIIELPNENYFISLHPDQLDSIVVPRGALGGAVSYTHLTLPTTRHV